ncbi:hypothetical protein E3N88_35634 [Mikania micrantha]|uniref:Uncharacterized protein n=1 Tax=Mikania micrantha TaxID=192012 RepID=A0A5N6M1G5_9ASTR|nr:hypothetical protein E3N88_35634 [Mikania micrantha]
MSDNGLKLSKLDRFLVSRIKWPMAASLAISREYSDHSPIILSTNSTDFGPIHFKLYNSWLSFPGIMDHIQHLCYSFKFSGPADLALATKLKYIKYGIKDWVAQERARRNFEYDKHKRMVEALESIAESRPLTDHELESRLASKKQWNFIHVKLSHLGHWKQILKVSQDLRQNGVDLNKVIKGIVRFHFGMIVGWLLECSFPLVYKLEMNKWCSVADRLEVMDGCVRMNFFWKNATLTGEEQVELNRLSSLLSSTLLSLNNDSWVWTLENFGRFSVKGIKNLTESSEHSTLERKTVNAIHFDRDLGIVEYAQ